MWQLILPMHNVINNHQACPVWPQYGLPLGFCIQWDYKKLNRNKQVSFAQQNKVHLFDATTTP
jgi:hypothetical protein